ncbi:MAG: cyclic nucleotide-binding domain-containing protein [Verrucomicrobiota bacterium]|nr:cyclic nucleotide-binding domain-containing protein [Verrucomicrobiota bacterium]
MNAVLNAEAFDHFSKNRLFEGIRPDLLEELAHELRIVRLGEGEVIFREGDPGDSLYLVGQGSVQISKRGRGGNQETLAFIQSGNFFGEMALLDGEPRSAMATAAESTLLGTVTDETFQHILELAPNRLHMNFLRSVSERLRQVNSHFITEVMRSERLSLVGSMANSIIHDLKNPICIVRCCSDLIASQTSDARVHDLTAMTNKAVEGMLSMTQELLDYARGSTALNKESVSIWRLMDELSQQALQLLPGQNVQFVKHLRFEGVLDIDLARFTRVLCNLIKNAREAMPGGGILTLSTDLVGGEAVLRLSDTGCGIPAEILPKLFEPFVTHGKSHGTGLGMAIAKYVIDAHGGKISVSSVPGNGTTVDIRLPTPALTAVAVEPESQPL